MMNDNYRITERAVSTLPKGGLTCTPAMRGLISSIIVLAIAIPSSRAASLPVCFYIRLRI